MHVEKKRIRFYASEFFAFDEVEMDYIPAKDGDLKELVKIHIANASGGFDILEINFMEMELTFKKEVVLSE